MEDIGYIDEKTIDKQEIQRVRQMFWLYLALLLISLIALNVFFYAYQKHTLLHSLEETYKLELNHLGILSSQAVHEEQYPFIEWYIQIWLSDHPQVTDLNITAMNGTALIEFSSEQESSDTFNYKVDSKSSDGHTVHLSLELSLNTINAQINRSVLSLIVMSILISLLFSAAFWWLLIQRVISPLFKKLQHHQHSEESLRDKHSIQKAKRKLLKHQAGHDPLTGLINRRTFQRRLKRICNASDDNNREHILMFMDLDNFKPVNDQMGHAAGDELLKRIALQIRDIVRSNDTFARIGGDEFALLLEDCSMQTGIKIAGNICNAICNYEFHWTDSTFQIGISIGVVLIYEDITDYDVIMERVDEACYEAKRLGGCQISISGRISSED